jgi:hypothetical protein
MATSTVTKICVICGSDVAQVKRTKDAAGNYYCQPCWDKAREAQTTATPVDAGPREKNPVPLIVILSTVGSVVVLTIAWLLFFRPSWQDQHKAHVLDLITQANSLATNGAKNDAYSKYAELFKVVGDNPITDPDLQSKLTDARAAMIKLESAATPDLSKQTPTVAIASGASPIAAADMASVFGDQINQFHVDKDGTISSDTEQALYLPGTEDKDFVVSGEMWLTSGQSEFSAGGIIFHLREQDGKHRYELSAGGMRAKRILLEGKQIQNIASPVQSFDVPRDQWVQFRIQVAKDGIVVLFGDQRGEARGPLSITGRNSIDFSAGGKVRNLAIQKLDPPSPQPAMDQSRTQATSGASPTDVFGDQLKQFRVDDSGAISSDVERMLVLPGTENKDFVLTGEAWLTSGASTFDAGGVLFHLRKADDKHLYILSALGLRAKRVHVEGKLLDTTANPFQFSNMPRDQWVPFRIELAQSGMVVEFGGQRGEGRGPLTREGSNGIDLSAGGKIRNTRLTGSGTRRLRFV